jgi:hypothetical protein
VPKLLEGLKTWFQSTNAASPRMSRYSRSAPRRPPRRLARAFNQGRSSAYFLCWYLTFSISRHPFSSRSSRRCSQACCWRSFVRLLELVHVPRTLGSLIVVAAAVGGLVGIAASLRDPAQSWLTDSLRFSRLEERLRPITALFEKLRHATEQLEKATASRDGPPIQKVEVTRPGVAGPPLNWQWTRDVYDHCRHRPHLARLPYSL